MSGEKMETNRYRKDMSELMNVSMKSEFLLRLSDFINLSLDSLKFIIILYYGGSKIIFGQDDFTIGNLSTFLVYSGCILNLYETLRQIWILVGYNQDIPQLLRVFEAIKYKPKIPYDVGEKVAEISGDIEFCNISFRYSPTDPLTLRNINFKILQGQYVAFVGMSGNGKSTITKLMQRFYDPQEGSVRVDSKDIRGLDVQCYRQLIGYVQQTPILFDNTIEYNITYCCKDGKYTQAELEAVCKLSGCYDFIMDKNQFPSGFKTIVGDRGSKLSGGQVQRIAIARALMKKPRILILDEATSALDSENEHNLLKNVEQVVRK